MSFEKPIVTKLKTGTESFTIEFDLITTDQIKIEVKSAAYLQSWHQKELSKIIFSIKPSLSWNAETNKQAKVKIRDAGVYVFALLAHIKKDSINPLNLAQWQFYVLTIEEIQDFKKSQHSITLKSLESLTQAVGFSTLNAEFRKKCSGKK